MTPSILHNNLRLQLIVPVAITLLVGLISLISILIYTQQKGDRQLTEEISTGLATNGATIEKNLQHLAGTLRDNLNEMTETARDTLTESSEKTMSEAAEEVQKDLREIRRQNGKTQALLLAQVAANAVISHDLSALNRYVRGAHRDPDVVFVFYTDSKGAPLTRYLNRKNTRLKSYLTGGRPDVHKIIQAGQDDPDVLVTTRDISSEGEIIGKVHVALDMSKARIRAMEIKEKFDNVIEKNGDMIEEILNAQSVSIFKTLKQTIADIKEDLSRATRETREKIINRQHQLASRTKTIILISSILILALILTILLLNARSILRLLGGEPTAMVEMASRIAKGDLDVSLTDRPVKGSLQAALQEMVISLQTLIGKLIYEAGRMADTSHDLGSAAAEMSRDAEQSAKRANTVAAATEEMSANMNTVSMASEQAAGNVNIVATAVEEMTSAVKEIAGSTDKANRITNQAVGFARSSSEKVNTLGQAANEISKVTEVITEISEQTNLLALNATIEAARAGEAGKGFAVVANEIKELAKQTAQATGEIKEKIESIQNSTDDTVTEINQITQVINEVNEIVGTIATAVEQQSITTADIAGNVNEAAQGIAEVNENVVQSSEVAGEVARDIAEVSELANNSRKCSVRVEVSAQLLTSIVDELQQETSRFDLGNSEAEKQATESSQQADADA